ncbi:uncharacterized protein EMH_0027000 [Eimeria mitis]|uniref:Uncharacterized protein n=1 Tax=Eimeria mitis TaxID=44415 RepID=U6KJD4_9EIME|nr:uncharacterized protein EMH_0027000 [Eimeria mitis]CDJ35573.1 hypothetical protein EMH_0027000 [Eimeria mitis]
MADRLLAQSEVEFAVDLGDRYAASGLYAQAAKCHSVQGLRAWCVERGEAARRFSLSGDPKDSSFDAPADDDTTLTPLENSIKQIDLNIRMVGLQRALVRDTVHLFCVLAVSHLQAAKRERALLSGVISPAPAQHAVSAEEVESFCDEVAAAAAASPNKHSRQNNSAVDDCRSLLSLLIDLQRVVYAPLELLDLLNLQMRENLKTEQFGFHFPAIAALRLQGQCVATAAVRRLNAYTEEEEIAKNELDNACMAFLSFGAAAARTLQQPRILSNSLKDLLALSDVAVRESCARSLKRLSVVLHVYARSQWGNSNKEVTMVNAEGEAVEIPAFLWPAWRLAECGQPFDTLINLYLSLEEDELAKQQSRLESTELQTIFCWIFDQWLTSQDDVAAASTYVGLLHRLTEAGDLPYFASSVSGPLLSQLNEEERARADVAAQQLTDSLLQIELAMGCASRSLGGLKDNRHFVGVNSRLAIIKQQVAEYRAALHKQAVTDRFTSF